MNESLTGKAKQRIKYVLKEEKRYIADQGKEILAKKFKHEKTEFSKENILIVANFPKFVSY